MVKFVLSNYEEVKKGIEKKEANLAKAVNAMSSDFRTRVPGWIGQQVTEEYTIKKKDVNEARRGARQQGALKIAGITVKNWEIQYSGRVLTPIHFKMSPKMRPQKKKYNVKVEIRRGIKKTLPPDVFLARGNAQGQLPFQRTGPERLPINPIKTLSVPQMITNEKVAAPLQDRINTELDKRLQYHINRFNNK